ncbi:hypothetical protein ABZW30_12610 [Kitasatospora sp. NPDC004669]|uniref:hypothetical protein n=1 Tax=Kitasatospora sp. NPDC004669 TaxID=3154555 RepID=UPI0033AF0FEB
MTHMLTSFMTPDATAIYAARHHALCLHPEGRYTGLDITLLPQGDMPLDAQLAVAERILAGVQQWRDGIAAAVEQAGTAEDGAE